MSRTARRKAAAPAPAAELGAGATAALDNVIGGAKPTRARRRKHAEATAAAANAEAVTMGVVVNVMRDRDEARAIARVLAHAYTSDTRPPAGAVERALAYPAVPGETAEPAAAPANYLSIALTSAGAQRQREALGLTMHSAEIVTGVFEGLGLRIKAYAVVRRGAVRP